MAPKAEHVAMDSAHIEFIYGAAIASKPRDILELGIGSGRVTLTLARAILYNQTGKLTSVDNWNDWGGNNPGLTLPSQARIVVNTEEDFVREAPDSAYDFLVSDADHNNSGNWFDQHCRITKPDGLMFFHDTNNPEFPTLYELESKVRVLKLPFFHFKLSTRPDERCERGLLFVVNKK